MSPVGFWKTIQLGRRNSQCKGPGAEGVSLEFPQAMGEGETGGDSKEPVGNQLTPSPLSLRSPSSWEVVLASLLLMPCPLHLGSS